MYTIESPLTKCKFYNNENSKQSQIDQIQFANVNFTAHF